MSSIKRGIVVDFLKGS